MGIERSEEYIAQAIADKEYWESLAPEGYRLMGFTYRSSALFDCPDGRNTINITSDHINFFKPRD